MAYEFEAMIVAVSVGFVLWIVTQVNVLKTGKAIKDDIDSKRAATEKFVDERLGKVESLVVEMEGRLRQEMPPNVDGRIAAVQEKIETIDRAIGAAFERMDAAIANIPKTIEMHELARRSVGERDLRRHLDATADELQEIAEGELTPYVDQGDQFATEMLKWAKKPVDADYEAKSPLGAGLLRVVKGAVAKEAAGIKGGTSSGTRTTKGGSPYGV